MKANKSKALTIIGAYTVITFLDILFTYIGTPDLTFEANPLVAVYGHGWGVLLGVNLIVHIIYCLLVYYAYGVYQTPKLVAANQQELKLKIEDAQNWQYTFAMFGKGLGYSMLIARSLVVTEWGAKLLGKPLVLYTKLRGITPFARPDIFLAGILTIILSVKWIVQEGRNMKNLATVKEPTTEIKEEAL